MTPTSIVDPKTASLPQAGLALLRRSAFLILLGLCPRPFFAQTPPFRISGVVVNASDSSPIPRCRLVATLAGFNRGGNRQPVEAQSDEHGRFALELPSAGNWRLTAAARNVHLQSYDQHENFFTGIVLTAAQPTYTVVFRAVSDAVLAGVVIDEAGEPVRTAPVSLIAVDASADRTSVGFNQRAQQAQTDDRGRYEFAGLEAGKYLINVRARPWYAPQGGLMAPQSGPSPDPSLDLVYPITWYPGTTEDAAATPLSLRPGDRIEADFHLLAIPSAHLLLPSTSNVLPNTGSGGGMGQVTRGVAQVSLLLPNGGFQQIFGNFSNTPSGEVDMGGLAPGTYQVTFPGANPREPGRTTVVHIAAGGTVTEVGSGAADSSMTLTVDGDTSLDPSQITLVDTATGRLISPASRRGRPGNFNPGGFNGPPQQRRIAAGNMPPGTPQIPASNSSATSRPQAVPSAEDNGGLHDLPTRQRTPPAGSAEVTVDLPPGRYEVTVPGNSGAFLTGLTATDAQVEGRFVTLREGSAHLVIHLASGLATVDGVASLYGKPDPGALILLIPATLGASTSLATVHRDQSNTDGGFRIAGVMPGQYILVAIDRGWAVHWNDPATLRPYLLAGTPLDVTPAATAHATLQAVAP